MFRNTEYSLMGTVASLESGIYKVTGFAPTSAHLVFCVLRASETGSLLVVKLRSNVEMMRVSVKIMKKESIRQRSVSASETELLLVMKLRSNVVMMRVGVKIMKKKSIRQRSVNASENELLLVMKLRSNVSCDDACGCQNNEEEID